MRVTRAGVEVVNPGSEQFPVAKGALWQLDWADCSVANELAPIKLPTYGL